MKNKTLFLHGLESSSKGTKGRFFQKNFPHVICPDFTGTLENRLEKLLPICGDNMNITLIGSSFGGLMATCYAISNPDKVARLILLAPALNFADFRPPAKKLAIPTLLVVGKNDNVTPADLVVHLAKKTFSNIEIKIPDDDHMLHQSFENIEWQRHL